MIDKVLLARYILAAMTSWVPVSSHGWYESTEKTQARYESTAADIAEVVADEGEDSVLAYDRTISTDIVSGDSGRASNGILLAGIGAYEGGYQAFVDEGKCNLKDYVADGRGNCDHGAGWTIWQIHTMGGLVLTGPTITSWAYVDDARSHPEIIITGQKMIASRKLAARVALHIVRKSVMEHYKTRSYLCAYTGEDCAAVADDRNPAGHLARDRWNRGKSYTTQHTWTQFVAANTVDFTVASTP